MYIRTLFLAFLLVSHCVAKEFGTNSVYLNIQRTGTNSVYLNIYIHIYAYVYIYIYTCIHV